MNFSLLPGITYFGKGIVLPGITLANATMPTPHGDLKIHGDTLQFEDLVVTFNVDEEFTSWFEIFDWMNGLGKPIGYEQFDRRKKKQNIPEGAIVGNSENAALYSDATLLIQTSAKNPKIEVVYKNISPISLSGLDFTAEDSDTNIVVSTASFQYDYYTIDIK